MYRAVPLATSPSFAGDMVRGFAEALDGKTVDWMEKVTDGQYSG